MLRSGLALAAALLLGAPATASEPDAQRLDDHTALIAGTFEPARQPDGNSILIEGPDGLIVFDTGRHKAQADRVIAAAGDKPVVAIVNSHWHLDHVSGNLALKAAYPGVRVYGTGAIDKALTGFLARGLASNRKALATGMLTPGLNEDLRGDIATVERGAELRPDVVLTGSITLNPLTLFVAPHAVTAADVWAYDSGAKRVLAGDLVTLPAPFLDTACPEGWEEALAKIERTPFTTLVPGHGPVMSRDDFRVWHLGFTSFIDCTGTERPMETCAGGWLATARHFLSEADAAAAAPLAYYYGELLRSGRLQANCPA
ncbi:MBL fold metallo-hydrolase [Sphingomonas sp. AOB5]|uniref:MBL fold metallo-hydrolase n=1 Tax=Sphingomonas sp. AOB5 TaxID=3034017 RepID=UPI0023F88137|nr:MBL fold metallo-hydrolase [Sphingomonas sp. AOB5]MDF7777686.1 MBL fold metallo-hydrolase [Sphingomonas sp. AOB5]